MITTVHPVPLSGTLRVIPSKSAAHRAILMSALAQGETCVSPLQFSRDIDATLDCAKVLGLCACRERGKSFVRLLGGMTPGDMPLRTLDCGESGSTLRFMIPLALDGHGPVRLIGHGRLMQRPLGVYEQLFAPLGVRWQPEADALVIEGKLRGGEYALRGDVSSQFITGLLFALPLCEGDSVIHITTHLESRAYVELTRRIQAAFGVRSHWENAQTLLIPGGQRAVSPESFLVEGDWSHAAFYLIAGAIGQGGPVTLTGLDMDSTQGDRAIADILRQMGADIRISSEGVTAYPSPLRGVQADVMQTPDLVPALAVAMAAAKGESRITGAARLRIKESDRLSAMKNALCAAGADASELPDGLIIRGGAPLHAAVIDGCNDHRIVMSMAVAAACLSRAPLEITDAQAVSKSAPLFWEEFTSLGGIAR